MLYKCRQHIYSDYKQESPAVHSGKKKKRFAYRHCYDMNPPLLDIAP